MLISNQSERWPWLAPLLLWLGLGSVCASALLMVGSAYLTQPAAIEHRSVTELQFRLRQVRADSLVLSQDISSSSVLERFATQLEQTDTAVSEYASDSFTVGASGTESGTEIARVWAPAHDVWNAQLAGARQRLAETDTREVLSRQLDEAYAVALSLSRSAITDSRIAAPARVDWMQLPNTITELRVRVLGANQDLVTEMAAPLAEAATDVDQLIIDQRPQLTQRTLTSLEAVRSVLDNAGRALVPATTGTVESASPAEVDLAAQTVSETLQGIVSAAVETQTRWQWLSQAAIALGFLGLVSLCVASLLFRFAATVAAGDAPAVYAQHSKTFERLADDRKRDYNFFRTLASAGTKRNKSLQSLVKDATQLSTDAGRLTKPRQLVAKLGEQHAATQRNLVNQLATVSARLVDARKQAQQWAERSDETARLEDSVRELGERAALLQVNARIRADQKDASLAEDFQRLNDSVVRVQSQTEALILRQAEASKRTLAGMQGGLEAHGVAEKTVSKVASQMRAYVNGQLDLSGRHDQIDAQLAAHVTALAALSDRAESDHAVEQRVLKANRLSAKFANAVSRASNRSAPDATQPARSAPRRARKDDIDRASEVDA